MPTVQILPRFSEAVRSLDDPGPERDHADTQLHACLARLVLDSGRDLFEIMTKHQAITLELPQGVRQHALRDRHPYRR